MKKVNVILYFLVIIGLLLTGCGKKAAEEASNPSQAASPTNTATTAAPEATEPVAAEDLKPFRLGLAQEQNDLTGILGIADDKGYLAQELAAVGYKLEVQGFAQAGPAVNEAFVSSAIDAASYGDFPVVVLASKGIDVKVVGVSSTQLDLTVLVAEDSEISTPKDLEGKKVIVGLGTVAEQYWDSVVEKYGIDADKVEIVNDPANALATFISGNADALVTVSLYIPIIEAKFPIKQIHSTRTDNPEWACQAVIAARNEFGKEHPEVLTALFKAYLRAYNDAVQDYDLFIEANVSQGVDLATATKVYEGYDIQLFDGDIAQENIDKLENLNTFLFNKQLISTSVDISSIIDTSYYEAAKKALDE